MCSCGSGLKYKKCCLVQASRLDVRTHSSKVGSEEISKKLSTFIARENLREERFGKVRPIIHADCHGYKLVAVGNQIHFQKAPKWKTFPDFLFTYVWQVLGKDWAKAEFAKPSGERNVIIQWLEEARSFQNQQVKDSEGLYGALPTGSLGALLLLAYDLYVLRDHTALQEEVVRRLKNRDQFQGARFELQVAATCIRASFSLEYEDESDISRKHPEFLATHKATGEVVAVEAKARHRPGILGFQGDLEPNAELKVGISSLLSKAFSKKPEIPYVIFVDLNLPPSNGQSLNEKWLREIVQSVHGQSSSASPDPFNLILFTNNPHHYVESGTNMPRDILAVLSKRPRVAAKAPRILEAIYKAARQFGNVPTEFPAD